MTATTTKREETMRDALEEIADILGRLPAPDDLWARMPEKIHGDVREAWELALKALKDVA